MSAEAYPFGETVEILDGTPTSQDGDGNDVHTWPVKATYDNVPLAPAEPNQGLRTRVPNEQTQGQDLVTIGLTAYLPDGADVTAIDRVTARGETWDVAGMPQPWVSPFDGWRPGVVVALRRITG